MRMFLKIFQQILVFGGIGVVIFVSLYVFVFDGSMDKMIAFKDRILKNNKQKNAETTKKSTNKKEKKVVKRKEKIFLADSRDFLDFDDIKVFSASNPIGLIVKKGKKEFVGVLEVHGVNYNLLSIEEREILEEKFAELLNGRDYSIQIFVQSRNVDIESYEYKYNSRLEEIKKLLIRVRDKIELAQESNEPVEKIAELNKSLIRITRQYDYGLGIRDWILQRCKEKSMIERKYYIVLSHKHNRASFKEELTYEEILNNAFFDISNKASSIKSALLKGNVESDILTGFQLADLLYRSYNKADSKHYKLNRALKSRFSHLYTTSKPVDLKRLERKSKEIDNELEELKVNSKEKVGA